MTTFYLVLGVGLVCALLGYAIDWYRKAGRAALYTKGGTPVMVDQQAEQRRKDLLIFQAIKGPQAPPAAPGLTSDRRSLTRAATLGDRRLS